MTKMTRAQLLIACSACFLIGWFSGGNDLLHVSAQVAPANKVAAPTLTMPGRLGGNLYLQVSAEYRACCIQIYQLAGQRLESILESAKPKIRKPAIVMDLDETVVDNSAFQTFLYQNKLEYTDELWADYEENYPQDVTLIPGVKSFIKKAESLGVTVIYLSNRSEKFKTSTATALEKQGINVAGIEDRLYLKAKDSTSSEKATRREAVAAKYNVLLFFGDNLRDFSESFAAKKLPANATSEDYLAAIKQRQTAADQASSHWGYDWFVLPNPVYGEWDKLIGPDPIAIMHPSSMKLKEPEKK